MEQIFDRFLKDNDRVSLIKYNKNCRLMFPLTKKCRNTAQLKNQIVSLKQTDSHSDSNIFKAPDIF